MSETVPSVSFELTGFDLANASQFVAKTYAPRWVRWANSGVWLLLAVAILNMVGQIDQSPLIVVPLSFLLAGLIGGVLRTQAIRRLVFKTAGLSPTRQGVRSVTLEERGLVYFAPFGQMVYPYDTFRAVLDWDGNPLFAIDAFEYIPIPASAFPTKDALSNFMTVATQRISQAKKDEP